jgi:hypothetical protein
MWNDKTYYMCIGAVWGVGITLIALMLIPQLQVLIK